MSERVKVGGIGKNPAIDKINRLNKIDVQNYAVDKMEQLLASGNSSKDKVYTKNVPIDFSKAIWRGRN